MNSNKFYLTSVFPTSQLALAPPTYAVSMPLFKNCSDWMIPNDTASRETTLTFLFRLQAHGEKEDIKLDRHAKNPKDTELIRSQFKLLGSRNFLAVVAQITSVRDGQILDFYV